MSYSYPGNIRELANIIERAFILTKTELIERKHLPETLLAAAAEKTFPVADSLKDLQYDYLLDALKKNNWNCRQTAEQLGMHKSTLYRKIKSFGILPPG